LKFGVIGYGSIGQRHVKNLISLGYSQISLMREIGNDNEYGLKEFNTLNDLLDWEPDAIILCNPSSMHSKFLNKLILSDINILSEKPMVTTNDEIDELKKILKNYNGIGMLSYNLRYHPCVKMVRDTLISKKLGMIYSCRFFVGQYLPEWRPKIDYSNSYSAKRKMGGGVLFDLIHEIDLACFLVGKPFGEIAFQVHKLSNLDIDSEDIAEILYKTKDNNIVSIHLDYLCQTKIRYTEIIGEKGCILSDLNSNQFTILENNEKKYKTVFSDFKWNNMYIDMLLDFIGCIKNATNPPVSLKDGLISNSIAIDIREEHYSEN